jgi:hypothetical protein
LYLNDCGLRLDLCDVDGLRLILTRVQMNDEREDEAAGECGGSSNEYLWEREPAAAGNCGGSGCGERGVGLLSEKDDLAAIGAGGKMRERGKAFVLGQDVFGERAELIGREVRAGLESFRHGSGLLGFVLHSGERGWRRTLQQSSQV